MLLRYVIPRPVYLGQVRRTRWTRLQWRLRGAVMWPAFAVLTVADAVLLSALPVWGDGPGGPVPAVLLAASLNLVVVALLAPPAGRALRRRRRDLPRPVATDYAGAALLCALTVALVGGGLAHRGELTRDRAARQAQWGAVAGYVASHAPDYRARLGGADSVELEPGLFRTCVPGDGTALRLCLFVDARRSPPQVTRDPNAASNAAFRQHFP
jgi:hypothetical protein